jgi:ABC-2 type transport system permease protein
MTSSVSQPASAGNRVAASASDRISVHRDVHPVVLLLRSELFRLRKRPLTWILFPLVTGTAIVFNVVAGIVATMDGPGSDARSAISMPRMMENAIPLVALTAWLIAMVFACGSLGNEFRWGTLRPLVARSGSRTDLLTAKWLSLLLITIILVTLTFASCIVCGLTANALVGDVGDISPELLQSWAAGYARVLFAFLPYLGLGFAVTLLTRSNAVGIGFGIGTVMLEKAVWELLDLATNAFDTVSKLGLHYPTHRLMDYHEDMGGVVDFRDGLTYVGMSFAWVVVFVVVSYVVFRRRDVTL